MFLLVPKVKDAIDTHKHWYVISSLLSCYFVNVHLFLSLPKLIVCSYFHAVSNPPSIQARKQ